MSNSSRRKKTLRILYADDNPADQKLLLPILTRHGHSVVCVEDGDLALQAVAANPRDFDLVITDNNMPHMDGIHLVAELRRIRFEGKIVVISGHLNRNERIKYEALGVRSFVAKPCRYTELLEAIEHSCDA